MRAFGSPDSRGHWGLLLSGLVFMAEACLPPDETDVPLPQRGDHGVATQAIQRGALETGFPAVGIVRDGGSGFCTGTLITPSLVLTARHCSGNDLSFSTGTDPSNFVLRPVNRLILHPYTKDFMLLQLVMPITGVAPLPINTGAPPATGTTCTAVGFGRHDEDGVTTHRIKRSAQVRVDTSDAYATVVSELTGLPDSGDSGGPLLCNGAIAAVFHGSDDGVHGTYATLDVGWIQNPYHGSPIQSATQVAQARNLDGHLEATLVKPGTNNVYESFQNGANGPWVQFYNYTWNRPATALSLATNGDGRLEAFYRSPTGVPSRYFQSAVNNSWAWGSATAIAPGMNARSLAVGLNANGALQAFYARNSDGLVHTSFQCFDTTSPRCVPGADFRDMAFDGVLYHQRTRPIEFELPWRASAALVPSVNAKSLAVGLHATGRLYLFFIGNDDGLYYVRQRAWARQDWEGPLPIGGGARALAVANNANGALELFYIGLDNLLYHARQQSGGAFDAPSSLTSVALTALAVSQNADGRLEVFSIGSDAQLRHQWQRNPNGEGGTPGPWSNQVPLRSDAYGTAFHVAMNADGRLSMLYLGTDGATYDTHQVAPNGAWSPIAALP